MASDLRGSPNRSQSLSQTLGKNLSKQIWPCWMIYISIPMCHEKKSLWQNDPKGLKPDIADRVPQQLAKDTTLYSRPWTIKTCSSLDSAQEFQVFDFFCFFFKLKTVFPIHFSTQLWFATSSSDMMDYISIYIHTVYKLPCITVCF